MELPLPKQTEQHTWTQGLLREINKCFFSGASVAQVASGEHRKYSLNIIRKNHLEVL